ncbi:hypothetical protein OG705_16705 [Streptomyces sp. NBC_00838]|uniref:hypothetical protein n=1 Tax=Streptomyces sp. NBC_00838 TaxID=2903680 RepID=UPI00386C55ED|nr:hypothetical protein OG705_16705 [Streptomyces sp. NBC_00838]
MSDTAKTVVMTTGAGSGAEEVGRVADRIRAEFLALRTAAPVGVPAAGRSAPPHA